MKNHPIALTLLAVFLALPCVVEGHGFTVNKVGTNLTLTNDDPVYSNSLFAAGAFNTANSPMTLNEPSLAPAGFAGSDVLSFEVDRFLKWNGSLATPSFDPAPVGTSMTMTHRFVTPAGSPLVVTGSSVDVPGFDWMVLNANGSTPYSSHAVQYSMPGGTPTGVYFLGLTATGHDALGSPFGPSPPLYFAFNVGVDTTTYQSVQAAFATSIAPEPSAVLLAGIAVSGFAILRRRIRAAADRDSSGLIDKT